MTPPRGRIFIGSGDFTRTGKMILDNLVELGGLQPHHRVLDVGSGIGRIAVPLIGYLNSEGAYEGFDIVKSGIKWCRQRISKRYLNFRFTHIDLRNDLYNLKTDQEAKDFVFPYDNDAFDLVFLVSVFTHMVLPDVDNYLKQIHRVLKSGGVCYATFFIMNKEARRFMNRTGKEIFETDQEHHYLFHPKVREANVAYEEDYLTDNMIKSKGFDVKQIQYGFWSGRPKSRLDNFQDIVIFRKR